MDEVSQQPEVTVVIPTYNRCQLLRRTLSSVLAQTEVRFEVIVVDDGSSDATSGYLLSLRNPVVVVVRHEAPRGVSAARNAGLSVARGTWIAFTDDDDLWAPDKLRAQLDAARLIPNAGWVAVGEVIVDPALRIIAGRRPPRAAELRNVLLYNIVPAGGSGTMVRTELLRRIGGFSTDLMVLADWDLWIRLFLASPAAFVRRPLVAYLRHATSMSHNTELIEDELAVIISRYTVAYLDHRATFLRTVWLQWVARMHLQAHERAAAARTALVMFRHWREWPAFIATAISSLPRRRGLRRWRREGERWLAPIRDLESAQPNGRTATSRSARRVSSFLRRRFLRIRASRLVRGLRQERALAGGAKDAKAGVCAIAHQTALEPGSLVPDSAWPAMLSLAAGHQLGSGNGAVSDSAGTPLIDQQAPIDQQALSDQEALSDQQGCPDSLVANP